MRDTFRSLKGHNYRLWAGGALLSNIGTWMQRIAQDWLVLTQLTQHNASAVGVVMALQFGPMLLLLPWTGYAADRLNLRKLIFATQASMGLLALGLGILCLGGWARLWNVYLFALLLGCVSAFDSPARQAFVSELVGEEDLPNAVGLNATSFHVARMIGPAIAGLLIAAIGSGWVFILNAASFAAVLVSLGFLRVDTLHRRPILEPGQSSLADGFRYVWRRPDLLAMLSMFFLIGTFGLNFPIFISTMSVSVFHGGASQYGLLTSAMAIGSVTGAVLAAGRPKPGIPLLSAAAALFGVGVGLAACMPSPWAFGLCLTFVGVASQTFSTGTNSSVQLATEPAMRGRVLAILLAVAVGSTPLGAPLVGWVADAYGPRISLGLACIAGLVAALVGIFHLRSQQGAKNA